MVWYRDAVGWSPFLLLGNLISHLSSRPGHQHQNIPILHRQVVANIRRCPRQAVWIILAWKGTWCFCCHCAHVKDLYRSSASCLQPPESNSSEMHFYLGIGTEDCSGEAGPDMKHAISSSEEA